MCQENSQTLTTHPYISFKRVFEVEQNGERRYETQRNMEGFLSKNLDIRSGCQKEWMRDSIFLHLVELLNFKKKYGSNK